MTGIYLWEILPHRYELGSEGLYKVDANQLGKGRPCVLANQYFTQLWHDIMLYSRHNASGNSRYGCP